MNWDIFIIYAHEDKDTFVQPLAMILENRGLHVGYEEFAIKSEYSLREYIDLGLLNSVYGIIVFSKGFLAKPGIKQELKGLFHHGETSGKIILPILHGVSNEDIALYLPTLADHPLLNTDHGIESVITKLLSVTKYISPKGKDNDSEEGENRIPNLAVRFGSVALLLYAIHTDNIKIRLFEDNLTKKYGRYHPIMLQLLYALGDNSGIEEIRVSHSVLASDQISRNSEILFVPESHFHPESRAYERFLNETGLPSLKEIIEKNDFAIPELSKLDLFKPNSPKENTNATRFGKKNLYLWTGEITPQSPVLRKMKLSANLTYLDHVYIGGGTGWSNSGKSDVCIILTSTPRRNQSTKDYNLFYSYYNESIFPENFRVTNLSGGNKADWVVTFAVGELSNEVIDQMVDKIIQIHNEEINRIISIKQKQASEE